MFKGKILLLIVIFLLKMWYKHWHDWKLPDWAYPFLNSWHKIWNVLFSFLVFYKFFYYKVHTFVQFSLWHYSSCFLIFPCVNCICGWTLNNAHLLLQPWHYKEYQTKKLLHISKAMLTQHLGKIRWRNVEFKAVLS